MSFRSNSSGWRVPFQILNEFRSDSFKSSLKYSGRCSLRVGREVLLVTRFEQRNSWPRYPSERLGEGVATSSPLSRSDPALFYLQQPPAPPQASQNSTSPGWVAARGSGFPRSFLSLNRSEMPLAIGLLARNGTSQAAVLISQSPGAFPSGACQEERQRTGAVQDAVAPCQRSRRVHGPNACARRKRALHEPLTRGKG